MFQYSSWSGDIRTSFKAVLVDLISSTAGRKQETVKVQEKFLVKPAEDRYMCSVLYGDEVLAFSQAPWVHSVALICLHGRLPETSLYCRSMDRKW